MVPSGATTAPIDSDGAKVTCGFSQPACPVADPTGWDMRTGWLFVYALIHVLGHKVRGGRVLTNIGAALTNAFGRAVSLGGLIRCRRARTRVRPIRR